MSLNLNDKRVSEQSAYYTSPTYTDAVNDAQFVRTFGIVSIIGSILTILSGAIAIGVGMAVMGFGNTRYYRVLGLAVIIVAISGVLFPSMSLIAPMILSGGVGWKGIDVLGVLSAEGKGDPDWQTTHSRSVTGIVTSALAFLIAGAWLVWFTVIPFIQ